MYKIRVVLTNGKHNIFTVSDLKGVSSIANMYYNDYKTFEVENTEIKKNNQVKKRSLKK